MDSHLPPISNRRASQQGSHTSEQFNAQIRMTQSLNMGRNPFALPTDEEIFQLREDERRIKDEERMLNRTLRVQEKTTFTSRMGMMTREMVAEDSEGAGPHDSQPKDPISAAAAALPVGHRRRERENMAEFLAKKREIFLVQMSLDTKRAEIRKLDQRALQREEALKKSEQMLEEDSLRFDMFLKENDEKVQEAMKRAEIELKAKQDKVAEIKRLQSQIADLKAELGKYEEQLDDCKTYQRFLDKLTPAEWFESREKERALIAEARLERWRQDCEAIRKTKSDADAAKVAAERQLQAAQSQQDVDRAEEQIRIAQARIRQVAVLQEPPAPSTVVEDLELSVEHQMYWKSPRQLMEIFSQLEEQNLFLIQNAQETEEALDELKAKFAETRDKMESESLALKDQIEALKQAIQAEEERAQTHRDRAFDGTMRLKRSVGNISLEDLSQKVRTVYEMCGFEADASVGTLQMLTNIEIKLEEYLSIILTLPEDFVIEAEKAREKARRTRVREEKLLQQQKEQEARVKRALERAQAPIPKKTGKPVMFRSTLPKKVKKVTTVRKNDEEAELEAYIASLDMA